VEAKCGCNKFGGDTAEIYLYNLMPYDHAVDLDRHIEANRKRERAANQSLLAVLHKFEADCECRIEIFDVPLSEWETGGHQLSHWCRVKVIRIDPSAPKP
jgi:hypothetical protein